VEYQGRTFDFYCVTNTSRNDCIPVFAPSMFLLYLAKSGAALNTTKSYANDLATLFSVLERSKDTLGSTSDYRYLTENEMSGYLYGYLKQQRGLSNCSLERHIVTLSTFYKFSADVGFIETAPSFSFTYCEETAANNTVSAISEKLHKVYIDEDRFKSDVLGQINDKNPFIRERNELALKLGYYAGFRTHELVRANGLDNLNVDTLRELLPKKKQWTPISIELQVTGKGRKGRGKKTRTVQISVELTDALYRFLWGRAKHITTNLMCTNNDRPLKDPSFGSSLFSLCRDRLLETDIDEREAWKIRHYHTLRKCYATNSVTHCVNSGLDPRVFVKQWMGHEDYKTTEIYIFYDAVLHQRPEVIASLSLNSTVYGARYQALQKAKGD